jgi:hypothetical protein
LFKFLINFCLILLAGCAQVTSLGLKKHSFGVQPSKIIWIQVAGLHEEHLAMLKNLNRVEKDLNFEQAMCFGKLWNYNLYELRNPSIVGFNVQSIGTKNIKNNCTDYDNEPAWAVLKKSGYKSSLLEIEADEHTSLVGKKCSSEKAKFIDGLTLWVASSRLNYTRDDGSKLFHANQLTEAIVEDRVYFDRSCSAKGCYTTLLENAVAIHNNYSKNKPFYSFLVRDFSYELAMQAKDYKKARDILMELDKLLGYFQKNTDLSDTLILLSSTAPIGIELPNTAAGWKSFINDAKAVTYRSNLLMSTALAYGARSENFCGIYHEVDLFKRVLSGPKEQGLEFVIVNPFQ